MSRGQHRQANKHPKSGTRGGRLASKLGRDRLTLGRLEQLLKEKPKQEKGRAGLLNGSPNAP